MSDYPKFSSDEEEPNSIDSLRPFSNQPQTSELNSLFNDKKFRTAWVVSIFLHIVIFASAIWSPSSAKYRFYGSGTAVSLVGADEIPGGSARGKSGDRPKDLVKPDSSKEKKARKIEVKKKVEPKKEKKKKTPKKIVKSKPDRKIAVKPKKKKPSKKQLARLRRIKERRERERKWRRKWEKQKKTVTETAKKETESPEKSLAPDKKGEGAGKDPLAKTVEPPREKPLTGYPGEGGGDGQGGGSLGGGSGGVARTDIERYYGILAERVRNFWTVPPNLTSVANLKTEIVVDVARDGTFRNLRIK